MTATASVPDCGRPFWDAGSKRFDGTALRVALVTRGWTVREFARTARVSSACLYNALSSRGVSDRTVIRIFETLAKRQPMVLECLPSRDSGVMAMAPSRHHY